jgi:hypothetical protein
VSYAEIFFIDAIKTLLFLFVDAMDLLCRIPSFFPYMCSIDPGWVWRAPFAARRETSNNAGKGTGARIHEHSQQHDSRTRRQHRQLVRRKGSWCDGILHLLRMPVVFLNEATTCVAVLRPWRESCYTHVSVELPLDDLSSVGDHAAMHDLGTYIALLRKPKAAARADERRRHAVAGHGSADGRPRADTQPHLNLKL